MNCDLYFVDASQRCHLLVDGSPGSGVMQVSEPRSRLFSVIGPVWERCVSVQQSPADTLDAIGAALCEANQTQKNERLWCSAAMIRLYQDGACAVAEVGDTKLYHLVSRQAAPVFAEPMPVAGRAIPGALGTESPSIRSAMVRVASGEELRLMTDGAYHILREFRVGERHGLIASPEEALSLLDEHACDSRDDSTLVVVQF